MKDIAMLAAGKYMHYKGNIYEVIGVGKHTETEEDVVIYRPSYDSSVQYWVRPLAMFCDNVSVGGATAPRFRKISDDES